MKHALILGVLGQDGFYLSKLLADKKYKVFGSTHRPIEKLSSPNNVEMRRVSLTDNLEIRQLLVDTQPSEIYNLAARASSAQLFDDAVATGEINGIAVARLLAQSLEVTPNARFCQALSSEVFGAAEECPQNEKTAPVPRNAYGAAKAYAWHILRAYRSERKFFACGALLYNHESPRRDPHFVTRKVARAAARIAFGTRERLKLGSPNSRRDWGHSADAVRAMYLMLQQDEPDDYVICTGVSHSVAELCEIAFSMVGLDFLDHVDFDASMDPRREYYELRGDPSRARDKLGWQPEIEFKALVQEMVEAELQAIGSPHGLGT